MAQLKVFSGCIITKGKQVNAIVATTSQKKASELLGVSLSYVRDYFSMTVNKKQIDIATSKPDVVFVTSHGSSDDYTEYKD